MRFVDALRTYDPLQQQPEPPGYPLYVGAGRLVNFFVHDPFAALISMSVVSAVAGATVTALAATALLGSAWAGAAAAIMLYLSPAMLLFDPLPNSESALVLCIALAFLALARDWPLTFGVAAAAAIGVHPETAPAVLVLVLGGCAILRRGVAAAAAFAVSLAVFFAPLLEAIGVSNVTRYARTNFAALQTASSAAGLEGREAVLRFVAHAWGGKFLSFPLLMLALVGMAVLLRRRSRTAVVLALFAAVHIAFCLAWADRGDGVQPVIPALAAVAIFAAAGLSRWPLVVFALAAGYGIGGYAYALPVLAARRSGPSPPAAATAYAARSLPRNAMLLYDPSVEAYAQHCGLTIEPLASPNALAGRAGVPLYLFADGGSSRPGTKEFAWPDSDAYGKITTPRYRVASIVPLPSTSRYRAASGVYPFERTMSGEEWRWVGRRGELEVPRLGAAEVAVTLGLPADAPIERNEVTITSGNVSRTAVVSRGRTTTERIPLSAPRLVLESARVFRTGRDQRELAVQLISVDQIVP